MPDPWIRTDCFDVRFCRKSIFQSLNYAKKCLTCHIRRHVLPGKGKLFKPLLCRHKNTRWSFRFRAMALFAKNIIRMAKENHQCHLSESCFSHNSRLYILCKSEPLSNLKQEVIYILSISTFLNKTLRIMQLFMLTVCPPTHNQECLNKKSPGLLLHDF